MLDFWSLFIFAALTVGVVTLPTSQSCTNGYPQAKHVIPLYRTTLPYVGNFEANITIGSQKVPLVLDTGSSDMWMMPKDVSCFNTTTLQPVSSELCGYKGPRLTTSSSFRQIPNVHLNTSYKIGEWVIAENGYDNVSFGGIEVQNQEIALAKTAALTYPGYASGILGLAYPALTDVYPGDDPSTDVKCPLTIGSNATNCNQQTMSPFLSTVFANSLAQPLFSFAISRNAPAAGVMTIGGIPDIHDPQVNVTNKAIEVTVPLEKLKNTQENTYYIISVDGLDYKDAPSGAGKGQWIVDTGAVPIIFDQQQAKNIGALFDPPAWFDEDRQAWIVKCNATAPELSVKIGGQNFGINPKDLILSAGQDDLGCSMGVQGSTATGSAPPVLGSVFLRSVLAVFDVGRAQMSFASRMHYQE